MKHRDLWFKDAIIYCLEVETFMDSNGDGIGDFQGLIQRLDYLAGLGVTCIWLQPFYPSPNRDNGYDVCDYYNVDPRFGTLGDFVEFITLARHQGMRVIIDLVLNHTSIDHPWFQSARQGPDSPYHDWYVWSDTKPPDAKSGIVFPGVQETTWTYDRKAKQYYFHRFYNHQPDLNIANPDVFEELLKIMGFWLQLGVDGFRLDALPFLIEHKEAGHPDGQDEHQYLTKIRQFLSWRRGDAVLLGEANISMDKIPEYFGEGDRMHMLFHFMLNQHLFLALARGDAAPLAAGLNAPPPIPDVTQWAIFLRNHDELSLDKLTESEREEVFRAFGPEPNMQIYDRGIRRRLAPMVNNDRRCLELATSLLFSLPGTPILRYGDEIGMGEDLSLPERESVRTPMQWSNERNGGFSTAPRDQLVMPVINRGEYGYKQVNFMDQSRDPNSLLNWTQLIIRLRKMTPEFGYGDWSILDTGHPAVLAHRCDWEGKSVLAVHNLGDEPAKVTLTLEKDIEYLLDLFREQPTSIDDGEFSWKMPPYGYRWFRIQPKQPHTR